jgi:hypothetical protein
MPTRARATVRLVLLLSLSLLSASCASLVAPNCARFEEDRKQTDYTPRYEHSAAKTRKLATDVKPLPGNALAAAPLYQAQADAGPVRHCTHLTIRKELYLQRADKARALVIEETREIFTEGGKRIATKTVDLSGQLAKPGSYSAKELLPIPEATPAGKYRVVSRLTYRADPKSKPAMLARATLNFEVAAKKSR